VGQVEVLLIKVTLELLAHPIKVMLAVITLHKALAAVEALVQLVKMGPAQVAKTAVTAVLVFLLP
jgi:hypothetical protein